MGEFDCIILFQGYFRIWALRGFFLAVSDSEIDFLFIYLYIFHVHHWRKLKAVFGIANISNGSWPWSPHMVLSSAQRKHTECSEIYRVVLCRPLLLTDGTKNQQTDLIVKSKWQGVFLEMFIRALQRGLSRGNDLLCQSFLSAKIRTSLHLSLTVTIWPSARLRYRLTGLPVDIQYKNISYPDVTNLLLEDLIIWTNYEIEGGGIQRSWTGCLLP